jgi:hypothetical protein
VKQARINRTSDSWSASCAPFFTISLIWGKLNASYVMKTTQLTCSGQSVRSVREIQNTTSFLASVIIAVEIHLYPLQTLRAQLVYLESSSTMPKVFVSLVQFLWFSIIFWKFAHYVHSQLCLIAPTGVVAHAQTELRTLPIRLVSHVLQTITLMKTGSVKNVTKD